MSRALSLLNPLNKGHGAVHDLYLNVSLQLVAGMCRDITVAERFWALVARICFSCSSIYSWISDSEAIFCFCVFIKKLGSSEKVGLGEKVLLGDSLATMIVLEAGRLISTCRKRILLTWRWM
jgi:hypothetical protein